MHLLLGMDYLLNIPENVVSEVLAGAESCYVSRLRCETATLSRKLSAQAPSLFFVAASYRYVSFRPFRRRRSSESNRSISFPALN